MRNLGNGLNLATIQSGRRLSYVVITGFVPAEVLSAQAGSILFGINATVHQPYSIADVAYLTAEALASEPVIRFSSILDAVIDEFKRRTSPNADAFVVDHIYHKPVDNGVEFRIPVARFSSTPGSLVMDVEMAFYEGGTEIPVTIGGHFQTAEMTDAPFDAMSYFSLNETWADVDELPDGSYTMPGGAGGGAAPLPADPPVATQSWLDELSSSQRFWLGVATFVVISKVLK